MVTSGPLAHAQDCPHGTLATMGAKDILLRSNPPQLMLTTPASPTAPRKCIWCLRDESEVMFLNNAHIVPKSLGGDLFCPDVCNACNHFFGTPTKGRASVEEAIKETFVISRVKYLHESGEIGPHKALVKPKSRFFDFDLHDKCELADHSNCPPPAVIIKKSFLGSDTFHRTLGRQLRRGLYKMYLERLNTSGADVLGAAFDYIRAFAYADNAAYDLPVLYFIRRHNAILLNNEWPRNPRLLIGRERPFEYLKEDCGFIEFDFMGHTFGLAATADWSDRIEQYTSDMSSSKSMFFRGYVVVESFDDIDIHMHVLDNDQRRYEDWIRHCRTKQLFDE